MENKSVIEMWKKYKKKECIKGNSYTSWYFGSKDMADRLGELVVSGNKRATTGLKLFYEDPRFSEHFPKLGDLSVITNSNGEALCIIKVNKIEVCKFNEVTEEFAYIEGEGDKSLKYWREGHRSFFCRELNEYGIEFSENMEVVLEYFEVVSKK